MNRTPHNPALHRARTLAALLALAASTPAPAQALRDPTRPPVAAGASAPRGSSAAGAPTLRQLMVVDGRRYVIDGSRRHGVGDKLGEARIERIEDAAVVVRDATGLHRLPLHAGVVKRPATQARPAGPNSR